MLSNNVLVDSLVWWNDALVWVFGMRWMVFGFGRAEAELLSMINILGGLALVVYGASPRRILNLGHRSS